MAERSSITLIYFGGDADQHRLNLYDASASYYGLARTLAIIGHYYVKGEIISHAPRSALPLYISPPEQGSFKQTIIAGAVGGIIAAPFGPFAERLMNSWIPPPNSEMQELISLMKEQNELLRAGARKKSAATEERQSAEIDEVLKKKEKELQTLRSVTSNSFKAIFRPVGRSVDAVGVIAGGQVPPSKVVDERALALIEADNVDEKDSVFLAVVNSFSRSSKTGIVFSRDFERGFRIEYPVKGRLPREDDFSWSQYSGKPLRLHGRFVRYFDGNIKKFLAYTVERIDDQDELSDYFSNQREVRIP